MCVQSSSVIKVVYANRKRTKSCLWYCINHEFSKVRWQKHRETWWFRVHLCNVLYNKVFKSGSSWSLLELYWICFKYWIFFVTFLLMDLYRGKTNRMFLNTNFTLQSSLLPLLSLFLLFWAVNSSFKRFHVLWEQIGTINRLKEQNLQFWCLWLKLSHLHDQKGAVFHLKQKILWYSRKGYTFIGYISQTSNYKTTFYNFSWR